MELKQLETIKVKMTARKILQDCKDMGKSNLEAYLYFCQFIIDTRIFQNFQTLDYYEVLTIASDLIHEENKNV